MQRTTIHRFLIPLVGIVGLFLMVFQVGFGQAAGAVDLSDELVTCMQDTIGADAFSAIASGVREPTAAEKAAGETCVAEFSPAITTPSASQPPVELSDDLKTCLEAGFGSDRFAAMLAGEVGQPTVEERTIAERCFATYGKPDVDPRKTSATSDNRVSSGAASKTITMPAGMVSCLEEALGADRYRILVSQGGQPTETERSVSQVCFEKYRELIHESDLSTPPPGTVMNPDTEACVRRIMGDAFETTRAGVAPSAEKRREVAETCFNMDADEIERLETTPPTNAMLPETQACMIEAFGEAVALQMMSGGTGRIDHSLIEAGKEKMQTCFARTYRHQSTDATNAATAPMMIPPDQPKVWDTFERVTACEQTVLAGNFEAFQRGEYSPTDEELAKMKSCSSSGSSGSVTPSVSTSTYVESSKALDSSERVAECTAGVLGSNYEAYKTGRYYPTEGEFAKLQSGCFASSQ